MSRMIHFFFGIEDCTECISSDFSTIIDRRLPRRCLRRDIEMNVAFHTLSDISWYAWNFDTAVHPRDSITARLKEIAIDTLNKFYATIGEVESFFLFFFLYLSNFNLHWKIFFTSHCTRIIRRNFEFFIFVRLFIPELFLLIFRFGILLCSPLIILNLQI